MKKLSMIIVALMLVTIAFSQKINLKQGNMAPLKGENLIEVQFTYEKMRVGKMTEEDYVKGRIEELNQKDGTGDRWHENWQRDRGGRFEPKFIELYNKGSKKHGLYIDQARDDTKFIMIVNTYFTEPGFNVGIQSRPALVSLTVTYVERANPEKAIAVFDIIHSRGSEAFDVGHRIQEAYAKAGKAFTKILGKHL